MKEIRIRFMVDDDYAYYQRILELAKRVAGTNSQTFAIICILQEFENVWAGSELDHPLNPVTLATFQRDGWRCQCGRRECGMRYGLQRHSINGYHDTAEIDECITLYHRCHDLVTKELAETILISPGKIKYVIKEPR